MVSGDVAFATSACAFRALESHRTAYVRQWQGAVVKRKSDFSACTADGGHPYRLSRCVLLAPEDKTFQGALVASMSIAVG